jgi:ABC-type multidrug transport system fused ATPase/permease subunit
MPGRFSLGRRGAGGDTNMSLRELFAPIVKRQKSRLVTMSVASIFGGLAEAAMLIVLARIAVALAAGDDSVKIDNPVTGSTTASIWVLLGVATALVVIRMALNWVTVVTSARAVAKVMLDERRELTHLLLGASWALQSSQREGRLQELISGYTAGAGGAVGGLTSLISNAFNLFALLAAALVVTPIAAAGAAMAALLVGLMLRPLRAAVRRRNERKAAANLALSTGVTEFASALQEIRIFGVEAQSEAMVVDLAQEANRRELSAQYIAGAIPTLYQGVAMLLIVGALAIAFGLGLSGLASLGAVMLILLRSLTYAQGVQGSIQGLHAAAPYVEVLEEEKDRYRAATVPQGGAALAHIDTLAFDDVSFAYDADVPVLRHVTFETRRGEIVGIVGPSGSGKSTLVQLLLRLREPDAGTVLVNGLPLTEVALDDWYRLVTFVSQDTRLFSGSVGDNIKFFRNASDDDVERAAKLAHIHDDIVSWPLGYDTPVGERGSQLSGGQRQRLCIARALVEDPDIVVMDEPTSALDVKSESLMRDTLLALGGERTVFVVAHRLSTLSICDRIMVVLGGEMQGFDSPDRLEADNPFYREALVLSGMR